MPQRKTRETKARPKPHVEGLTLHDLREARGVSRQQLAKSLGLKSADLLSKYERGARPMSREMLDWAAGPLKPASAEVDALLFAHRLVLTELPAESGVSDEELRRIAATALGAGWTVAETLRPALIRRFKAGRAAAARREAEELIALLKGRSAADRHDLVAVYPCFRTCDLVAVVCERSVLAAARSPAAALDLASLACFVAERVVGGEGRRSRAHGYALVHVANAQRVATDFDPADATLRRAWELWHAGTATDPDPLAEWRLLALEASLRREQHRFPEALTLLDGAQSACSGNPVATGRILVKRSNVLQQQGDLPAAVAALEEAAPVVEACGDRHLLLNLRFNQANLLGLLERYDEAAALLPAVRELAVEQAEAKGLALTRVLWLEARLALGSGRSDEALAALEQVRGDFTAQALPYEAALASLDLTVLWLDRGQTAEVREIAVGMRAIFRAKRIDREALAALALFCEAARQETATVEMARQVIAEIEKARRLASAQPLEGEPY